MNAGDLRHLVDLYRPPDPADRDSTGQPRGRYRLVTADVWARIEPLTGTQAIAAQQYSATATHKVTVRYWSGTASIQPYWRIVPKRNQNRAFHVEHRRDVEEREFTIELLCTEVPSDETAES